VTRLAPRPPWATSETALTHGARLGRAKNKNILVILGERWGVLDHDHHLATKVESWRVLSTTVVGKKQFARNVAREKWWRMKIRKRWEGAHDDPGTFSCETRMMLPLDDHSENWNCQVQLRLGAGTGVLASHSERTNQRTNPRRMAHVVLLGICVSCLAVIHLKHGNVCRGACDWAHVLNVIWRSCVCFLIPKL